MKPIRVFDLIFRRRLVFVGALIVLLVAVATTVGLNFFSESKKAKAFVATTDKLVVPENTLLYIGAPGYISQRIYLKAAEAPQEFLQINATWMSFPLDHVYNSQHYNRHCRILRWDHTGNLVYESGDRVYVDARDAWGSQITRCIAIVGDGSGMILRYAQSIDIYGTVIIGDRVVFEATDINIHSTGRIYANGQDNQLGYDDNCGAGGAGGMNGGATPHNINDFRTRRLGWESPYRRAGFIICSANQKGLAVTDSTIQYGHNLGSINNDVKPFFIVRGEEISGGTGGMSGRAIQWTGTEQPGLGIGTPGRIGVGGGGGSGPTGTRHDKDRGSSGGGGGGFGVVFKASNFNVNTWAVITAAGGNSMLSDEGTVQAYGPEHDSEPSAGFGGPGAGGVLIIDSPEVNFRSGPNNNYSPSSRFEIFNVNGGIFKPSEWWKHRSLHDPIGWVSAPHDAGIGRVIINAGSNLVSVEKTVVNNSAGGGTLRPNYVFQPNDVITVTLLVQNMTLLAPITITDEIFYDRYVDHLPTVVPGSVTSGGVVSGDKVVWNFASPQTTSITLEYKLLMR